MPPWASFTVPATVPLVACAAADAATPMLTTVMAATIRYLYPRIHVMVPPGKQLDRVAMVAVSD
jgi:hypothetical protein